MVLVADNNAAEVLEPGVHVLELPAPFVATQSSEACRHKWPASGWMVRLARAGYRYQPPQMGFWVDPPGAPGLGVYGAASGPNKLGQYYCWNRTYDPLTGRWTTPDPVAMPWWNLVDYMICVPNRGCDPSGMDCSNVLGSAIADYINKKIQGHGEKTVADCPINCEAFKKYMKAYREGTTGTPEERQSCLADIRRGLALYCEDADAKTATPAGKDWVGPEMDKAAKERAGWKKADEAWESDRDKAKKEFDRDLDTYISDCKEAFKSCNNKAAAITAICIGAAAAGGAVAGAAGGGPIGVVVGVGLAQTACLATYAVMGQDCIDSLADCKKQANKRRDERFRDWKRNHPRPTPPPSR